MSSYQKPFEPIATVKKNFTQAGTDRVALPLSDDRLERGPFSVRVVNKGADNVHINFGGSSVEADVDDMPILANSVEVFTFPGPKGAITHVAGYSDDTNSGDLWFTVGQGY